MDVGKTISIRETSGNVAEDDKDDSVTREKCFRSVILEVTFLLGYVGGVYQE